MAELLKLVFPPKCLLCDGILENGEQDICISCRKDPPVFTGSKEKIQYVKSWTSVWFYEDKVRESILRFKFGGRRHYAARYAPFLAKAVEEDLPEDIDLITYVPVDRLRRWKRGYDQVELLAKALAPRLGLPCLRTLKKVRHTPAQSSLKDVAARRANVLGAYRPYKPENVSGKRVLLLDDVITTGATTAECAKTLLLAGAEEVYCASVAKRRIER